MAGYLISGLVVGSQYALFASGLALLFGTSHVLNFAHGVVFVAGGYALAVLAERGLTDPVVGVVVAALVGGLFGAVALEAVLSPLRSRSRDVVTTALVTVGATLVALAVIDRVFGSDPKGVAVERTIVAHVGGVAITNAALLALISAPVIMAALGWMVRRTRFGLKLRAVAGGGDAAALAGIDSRWVTRGAVLLSAVLAAFAGALYASNVANISPGVGDLLMVKGIALVVVGGMGSVGGAVLVAYAVGVGEALTIGYVGSGWKELTLMLALILVLVVKPTGLFGRAEIDRL